MQKLIGLLAGIVFGFGLALSGMTDTHKVLGFLSILHNWDYDLAFVMAGALVVTTVAYQLSLKRGKTLLGGELHLPAACEIDAKLLSGSAIFGIGWGLFGYCPGPALTALIYVQMETLVFVIAMVVGMLAHDFFDTL